MSALSGDPRREAGALALLESGPPYDCEHVVPQSWFRGGHSGVPKGDLHHLFTCKHACNGYRASVPFWEFPDHDPAGADCGWKEPDRFEPAEGRSQAARAVFYFLLRYPGMIDDVPGELQRERLGTLLAWHQLEPPTLYELHRNAAIQEKQGVRNPLIDFPQLASRIDFTQGLGG
ncbi:MAG: endonuclease [Longimicrobiaceae bacterium]